MDQTGRDRARNAVIAEMALREWNPTDLARAAGIDPGTAGDFLNGTRWLQIRNQGKVEVALGWEPGQLNALATSTDVSPPADDGVLLDLPKTVTDGLTAAEIEELKADLRARSYKTAAAIRQRLNKDNDE